MYLDHYISKQDNFTRAAEFEDFVWKFCKHAARKLLEENKDSLQDSEALQRHLAHVKNAVKFLTYKCVILLFFKLVSIFNHLF